MEILAIALPSIVKPIGAAELPKSNALDCAIASGRAAPLIKPHQF
ncbi:hypothetical protein [Chamaesiphon sp. VAR_69_metabat_338]|nr:hypothetical protein [Chamaesiphon sp. VAR_69_metabat_338]